MRERQRTIFEFTLRIFLWVKEKVKTLCEQGKPLDSFYFSTTLFYDLSTTRLLYDTWYEQLLFRNDLKIKYEEPTCHIKVSNIDLTSKHFDLECQHELKVTSANATTLCEMEVETQSVHL